MAQKKFVIRPRIETWRSDWKRNEWRWVQDFINKYSPSDLTGVVALVSQPNAGPPYNFYVWCRQGPKGSRYRLTMERWTGPTMVQKLLGNRDLKVLAFYTDIHGTSYLWILEKVK